MAYVSEERGGEGDWPLAPPPPPRAAHVVNTGLELVAASLSGRGLICFDAVCFFSLRGGRVWLVLLGWSCHAVRKKPPTPAAPPGLQENKINHKATSS